MFENEPSNGNSVCDVIKKQLLVGLRGMQRGKARQVDLFTRLLPYMTMVYVKDANDESTYVIRKKEY